VRRVLLALLPAAVLLTSSPAAAQSAAELRSREAQQSAEVAVAADEQAAAEAQRLADETARVAAEQEARRAAAERRTTAAREQLARYAAAAYRSGAADRSVALWSSLLDERQPQALLRGLGTATRVGDSSGDAFEVLERAEAAQAHATRRAQDARAQADAARTAADAAAATAAQVVAAAAARRTAAETALAGTQQALAEAVAREERLARAEALARTRSAVPMAAIAGALVPRPIGSCAGGSLAGHPNGRLPTDALCPLWGTSGQLLRADAAAAFDAMSKEYGAATGEPLCVTDSYRSYDEQVAVKAAKPTLAAVPGSSNHGWGVALDLCGGVESFGTPAHRWMVENATGFGWYLPGWAQQSGSKPEAWHWEFAG
jgi:hypothetical protein